MAANSGKCHEDVTFKCLREENRRFQLSANSGGKDLYFVYTPEADPVTL